MVKGPERRKRIRAPRDDLRRGPGREIATARGDAGAGAGRACRGSMAPMTWGAKDIGIAAALLALSAAAPGPARAAEDGTGCAVGSGDCLWAVTLGGAGVEKGSGLAARADGGWIVAASARPQSAARDDAWVIATDGEGATLWERRLGGRGTDRLLAASPRADGSTVLAGHTRSRGARESDVWVVALGPEGRTLWERTFGGPANDRARSVAPAPDGGVYVGGFTASAGGGGRDAWVLALDAGGSVIWQQSFGGAGDEGVFHLAPMPGGGVALTGHAGGAEGYDLWAAALTASGETRWERRLDRSRFDAGTGILGQPDGGAIVAGVTGAEGSGLIEDGWALRLGPDGATVWERVIGGAAYDGFWAIAGTGAGSGGEGAVLAGSTKSSGAGSADAWIVAIDGAGATLSETVLGGALWDRPSAVAVAPSGEIVVAGTTTSAGAGYEDVWLFALTGPAPGPAPGPASEPAD